MGPDEVARIVASSMSVADKIRALSAQGYARADIARALGKRYQHVRNVLEGDRLHGEPRSAGVAESAAPFAGPRPAADRDVQPRGVGAVRLAVREDGSVVLPEEVRLAFGARSGGVVMAQLDGDEFKLVSVATALKRVRARLAPYFVEGVSWVDELIAERRNEQEREDQGA